jgi:ribosomal protein S18 acetylase RimI-like enzyme
MTMTMTMATMHTTMTTMAPMYTTMMTMTKSKSKSTASTFYNSSIVKTSLLLMMLLLSCGFVFTNFTNTTEISSYGIVVVVASAFVTTTATHHTTAASTTINNRGGGDGSNYRRRRRRLINLLSSSSSTNKKFVEEDKDNDSMIIEYIIRDCSYKELNQVATLIVNGFNSNNTTNKMNTEAEIENAGGELNRLQQNYPYMNKDIHRMLIIEATTKTKTNHDDKSQSSKSKSKSEIVGFCDIDCRPYVIVNNESLSKSKSKLKVPRPYISDLIIDINHRRKGLAKKLIIESEQFVIHLNNTIYNNNIKNKNKQYIQQQLLLNDIWIRVEENNIPAIELYTQNLVGYKESNWIST